MKHRKPAIQVVEENVAESLTTRDRETMADLVGSYRDGRITRRSFMRSSTAFGLSMTSLSAVLAACGSSQRSENDTGDQAGGRGKLAIGIPVDVDTLDPQAFKTIPGYYMLANLYDQLIDLQAKSENGILVATGEKPAPMIASKLEVSRDRRKATFTLNPKATFADGKPITVEDVEYTFRRGIEGTQYTKLVMGMLTLSSAKNIEIVDKQTVAVTLDKSNPMLERLLNLQVLSIQSKSVGEKHATRKDKWADEYWRANVYGNGAYTLKSRNRGEGFELAPNRNYYQAGLPKNGGLQFRIISDAEERLNLLKAGTLHVAYDVPAKDAAAIRDAKGGDVKLISRPSPWSFGLTFNNKRAPFNDKRVRQALAYAIPYQAIIDRVMFGLARPAKSIVPPGMATHDESAWNYDTNPQKAKELLAAAGHPDGFKSSIDVLLGRPEDERAAVLIQASFREIGVDVDVNKLAEAQYQEKRNAGSSPMQIVEFYSWVTDPFYHMFWNMLSKNLFTNSSRYSNPKVDKLILAGLYELDEGKRESISKEAQRLITEDSPWAFLYARDFYVPVSSRLEDYPLWPDQNPRFYRAHLA
jgi:peptide/nickel transport system substrate-binding protein